MATGEDRDQLTDLAENAERDYQAAHHALMSPGGDVKTRKLALVQVLHAHSQRQVTKRQLIQHELLTQCSSESASLAMATGR